MAEHAFWHPGPPTSYCGRPVECCPVWNDGVTLPDVQHYNTLGLTTFTSRRLLAGLRFTKVSNRLRYLRCYDSYQCGYRRQRHKLGLVVRPCHHRSHMVIWVSRKCATGRRGEYSYPSSDVII